MQNQRFQVPNDSPPGCAGSKWQKTEETEIEFRHRFCTKETRDGEDDLDGELNTSQSTSMYNTAGSKNKMAHVTSRGVQMEHLS